MNYARIYAEFISDRLTKQPVKPTYFERHHIVPRCLGGGNEKSNIIRLTPEDHFFAHCCLAKIHGGTLWFAVKLMGDGWSSKHRKSNLFAGRRMVGIARRRSMEVFRELANKNFADGDPRGWTRLREANNKFNPSLYKWVNLDSGDKRESTIFDMHMEFGMSRAHWTSVQTGGRRSHNGWAIEGSEGRIRGHKGKSFVFVNRDGRTHIGTQKSFCIMCGLSPASGSRVVRRQDVTLCGWRLDGSKDRAPCETRSGKASGAQGTGKTYIFTDKLGKLVFKGKRIEAAKHFKCNVKAISAGAQHVIKGTTKTFKGCFVAEEKWQQSKNYQRELFAT